VISGLDRRSGSALGDSPEENESTHLFGSICSDGMLDIGQASTDASWGILARLFSRRKESS